ncbi:MAG: EpsG family protein [Bacteroidaceae bacterium]|nr:EpsG family protein [Bacteroidaceae bacterium]
MVVVLLFFVAFLGIYRFNANYDDKLYRLKRTNYWEIAACFILLYVFFGFRDLEILNDTNHYYQHFYRTLCSFSGNIFQIDLEDRFEPGFLVYENIIAYFFDDPYAIINVSALLITALNLFLISRFTNKVPIIIFFMLGTIMLNQYSGIRQGLALCMSNIAIWLLMKDKKIWFILLVTLAWTFHSSAIMLYALLLLHKTPLNKKTIFITTIAAVVSFLSLGALLEFVGKGESVYIEISVERETFPLAPTLNFLIGCIFLYLTYKYSKNSAIKIKPLVWWLSILNVICLLMDIEVQIMARFAMYFYFYAILLWWIIMQGVHDSVKRKRVISLMAVLILAKMIVIFTLKPEWYHIDPYGFYDSFGMYKNVETGY